MGYSGYNWLDDLDGPLYPDMFRIKEDELPYNWANQVRNPELVGQMMQEIFRWCEEVGVKRPSLKRLALSIERNVGHLRIESRQGIDVRYSFYKEYHDASQPKQGATVIGEFNGVEVPYLVLGYSCRTHQWGEAFADGNIVYIPDVPSLGAFWEGGICMTLPVQHWNKIADKIITTEQAKSELALSRLFS